MVFTKNTIKLQKSNKSKIIKYSRISKDLKTEIQINKNEQKILLNLYFFTINFVIFQNIRHKKI